MKSYEMENVFRLLSLIVTLLIFSGCANSHFASYSNSSQPLPQALDGYLSKPDGFGPFPAVVLLHGCAGINSAHSTMASQLVKQGYAALIVDSFGPRGLTEVCTGSNKADSFIRARDAYGALIYLQGLSFIDPNRIALIGWSHGATAALHAADSINFSNFPDDASHRFKAVATYYPSCNNWANYPTTFVSDILLMIGDSDDWTLSEYCERMVKGLSSASRPVDLVVYPGTTHSFDNIQANGNYLGHHLAYNSSATEDSIKRTIKFLKDQFK